MLERQQIKVIWSGSWMINPFCYAQSSDKYKTYKHNEIEQEHKKKK